jgi:hypothetical protein
MTEVSSGLRCFLKDETGAVMVDLTIYLRESIELAMVVTGVASSSAPVAANANFAPGGAEQREPLPRLRIVK